MTVGVESPPFEVFLIEIETVFLSHQHIPENDQRAFECGHVLHVEVTLLDVHEQDVNDVEKIVDNLDFVYVYAILLQVFSY